MSDVIYNHLLHIVKISHDGSGTIITAATFQRCNKPIKCKWCEDDVRAVHVQVLDGECP